MQVKVHNDNIHPYTEDFRGNIIKIPAKGCISMEREQAELFQGTFAPIRVDGDGNHTPEGYKMIRLEYPPDEDVSSASVQGFRCEMDGKIFKTEKELVAHVMANYKDKIVVDEEAERDMRRNKRSRSA